MDTTLPLRENAEEALRLQNARLAALHQVALGLTSTLDLREVLQRVVVMAQTLSASAHAHIFLYDSERDELNLAASHWSADQRSVPLQPRRTGVTHSVARSGTPEFIENLSNHPAYAHAPPDARPGALACLPLVKADHILGTLNLGYWEPHRFDADTRGFLDLMARQAAIAIETARLHADAIEKARLERELQVARGLQTSLIPRETPRVAGWDFAALWQPAHVVSGDFYDFVPVHDVPGLGIIIADVSDKGMPAALYMALARSTIRASITSACCPADCVTHANRVLCADTENGMFVTMCYAQLNPATGELVYVNAGHNPPLLYRQDRRQLTELARTDMVLGVDDTHCYEQRTLQLDPGDFVVFYTDGVTEAANVTEQEFGKEHLRQVVLSARGASAVDIIAALRRAVDEFIGSMPPFDDVTAVVVKRL
ncbi:MAG TPA: GAF domain-containing SpoIIE family protein phosphatase [Anaerolineae bacterium]|nr:GAF domain-containing SpoIIE family protein phosphatase [Anaerolineae bacterium]